MDSEQLSNNILNAMEWFETTLGHDPDVGTFQLDALRIAFRVFGDLEST